MATEGMGGGGQGIPMTSSPPQYTQQQQQAYATTQPQYQQSTTQQPHHQQGQHGGMQGVQSQMNQGMQQVNQGFQTMMQAPGQMMGMSGGKGDGPALAAMMMQPEEPTSVESCHMFLTVFIPLCAVASTILAGLAGSFTIGEGVGWRLALSATVITAVGVVGFELMKRLVANTSLNDAENAMGIAVLAHANIRAVAVKALAQTHWEVKKAEFNLRDAEIFTVVALGLVAAILSGVSAVFYDIRSIAIISAFFNALAGGFVVTFEILANGKKQACQRLEEQLRRNNLVADFLRADAGRKHMLLQDRVEALTAV